MNDAERRRRELLEQTRFLYSDKRIMPAVHPRYGNTYHYLYGKVDDASAEDTKGGTFGIRHFLCILIFVAFLTLDKQNQEIFHMSSSVITEKILEDMDIQEVWKLL